MEKLNNTTRALMQERFGGDSLIALATVDGGKPVVRAVNAHYSNGSFYVITHALSGKMRQIAVDPSVAICGDWFTAVGEGENLGSVGAPENAELLSELKTAFHEWIDNGHTDFSDPNTCILRVRLSSGTLFSHGTRHDIDFSA